MAKKQTAKDVAKSAVKADTKKMRKVAIINAKIDKLVKKTEVKVAKLRARIVKIQGK